MEFRILGQVDLVCPTRGRRVALLRQPKRIALLARLLLGKPRGAPVRRDTLLALCWPELDDAHARHALSQALHVLRHELGDGVLRTEGRDLVWIDRDALRCDAVEFEEAARSRDHATVLALAQGDFLAGMHTTGAPELEEWIESERSRFRHLTLESARALGAWERVVALDSCDGAAVRARDAERRAVRSATRALETRTSHSAAPVRRRPRVALVALAALVTGVAVLAIALPGLPTSPEPRESPRQEAQVFYDRAMEYRSRPGWTWEDAELTEQLLTRAIAIDSSFALAHAQLAMLHGGRYQRHDRSPERLEHVRRAVTAATALDPSLPEARLALGYYFYRAGADLSRARQEFARARQAIGRDEWAIASEAWIDRREGKWADAIAKLEKAAAHAPRNENFRVELARTREMTGDWRRAIDDYVRVVALSPDAARAQLGLAYARVRWEGAIDSLHAVSARLRGHDPEVARARYRAAWLARDPRGCLAALDSISPDVFDRLADAERFHVLRAAAHRALGNIGAATADLAMAQGRLDDEVERRPADPGVRAARAKLSLALGDREAAYREARTAMELAASSVDALDGPQWLVHLAEVLAARGEHAEAVSVIREALRAPLWLTVHELALDPVWDPLRGDPAFDRLSDARLAVALAR